MPLSKATVISPNQVLVVGARHNQPRRLRQGGHGASTESKFLPVFLVTPLNGKPPDPPVTRVLAALRPRMLELAARRTDGVHSYVVPVAHTPRAQTALGAGPLLVPELAVVQDQRC
jgi:hypothetical protein